jgi:hypothetical protein
MKYAGEMGLDAIIYIPGFDYLHLSPSLEYITRFHKDWLSHSEVGRVGFTDKQAS